MRSQIIKRRFSLTFTYTLGLAALLAATATIESGITGAALMVEAAPSALQADSNGLSSYFNSARNFLTTSLDAHNQARAYSSLMPNEDPRTAQMLRDTIDKTSNLIQTYQHEGLSNMPALPNVPGLNVLMRLPDKLLRAELSMLQDGIRMAQEMRERPLSATMNTPRGE